MCQVVACNGRRGPEEGSVLVPVFLLIFTMAAVTSLVSVSAVYTTDHVAFESEQARLTASADAAIDLAMNEVWSQFRQSGNGTVGSLNTFKAFLDVDMGVPDKTAEYILNYGMTTNGQIPAEHESLAVEDARRSILGVAAMPWNARQAPSLGGAELAELSIVREDTSNATALRVRAQVSFGADASRRQSATVERYFFISGEVFDGFNFALLANNVNCIMCHAQVDTTERYYNRDPAKFGTFPRTKVGTLESLMIRADKAESLVAGTIYTRGPLMNKDGSLLADLSSTTLRPADFSSEGLLDEDSSGGLFEGIFSNTVGDPLPAGGNLYLDYPLDPAAQTDGALPASFPAVVPDENGNRLVDPEEFALIATQATGTISGGALTQLAPGVPHVGSSLPSTGNTPLVPGVSTGNVIMIGTPSNPLTISGRIAIDGDVVLQGTMQGSGELIASGNIYIVGSISYADGTDALGNRTFGVAENGAQNRVTVAAGGNILVGDFLTPKLKKARRGSPPPPPPAPITGDATGGFNFTMSEITLFNRMEWTKAQSMLPGAAGPVPNPFYDPNHVPRYYTVNDGNPVYIYNQGETFFDPDSVDFKVVVALHSPIMQPLRPRLQALC